jgi:hypothetical protein
MGAPCAVAMLLWACAVCAAYLIENAEPDEDA